MLTRFLIGIVTITFSLAGLAAQVQDAFPDKINPKHNYVFYSHGFIVEGENATPVHPRWGKYDFPAVKNQLSDDGYQLIAYHRPKDTDPREHAALLAKNVNQLIDAGVPPQHIALVGFSRGGFITIVASNQLKNSQVNFAILAGCGDSIINHPEFQFYGRILSIYETSDQIGSCDAVNQRSNNATTYTELSISTGKEHGAFYLPREEWLVPLKQWLKGAFNQH
ncbi:alpha/beta hydrolase [Neptunicella sp. SCSIO 80796]|uniref:alpha/beta hydrolase n=1 Tax=Neptunicella plasticusilytica TaxID=3117012 RepID=UPI003A4DA55B